jgi:hypothetical protein
MVERVFAQAPFHDLKPTEIKEESEVRRSLGFLVPFFIAGYLCCGNGLADPGTTLSRGKSAGADISGLGNNLLAFGQDEFDVARAGHVGVDLGNRLVWIPFCERD